MASGAFDGNAQAGRSGNVRDNPERNLFLLEQGALLYVQLYKRFVVAVRQFHFFERCGVSGVAADLLERRSVLVSQSSCGIGRKSAREEAAAETSNSKARGFFGSEHQQLDGTLWMKTAALQRANRFEAAENADDAVILSG